jgi:hypothetical protein
MTEEDEAFNEIERRSIAKKEAVRAVITKEKPMNNKPAFPNPNRTDQTGMTLRDYFAAKAMQAQISMPETLLAIRRKAVTADQICGSCYEWADAMMKAREA